MKRVSPLTSSNYRKMRDFLHVMDLQPGVTGEVHSSSADDIITSDDRNSVGGGSNIGIGKRSGTTTTDDFPSTGNTTIARRIGRVGTTGIRFRRIGGTICSSGVVVVVVESLGRIWRKRVRNKNLIRDGDDEEGAG
ncbi:hypothetical protein L6452_35825 [Arctium lappa]|uniref:Uncharacterized protein n=1 Tax=Arctium lappa TaxID=4217 RepID=A0ACB8Y8Q6_ARCLA|nr:hypothetical protein L6452_35825 [Arctium lappa]